MFNIGIQVGIRYILVVLSGTAAAAEIQSMNVFVGDLLARTGRRRVLLDSFSFQPDLAADADDPDGAADAGKQAVIAHMKATIPQLERVAVLVREDGRRGFIRGAAAGREFEAAEFSDIVEAEKWLQADD